MKIKTACIIGFGTVGKRALEILLLKAKALGLEKVVITDIRNAEMVELEMAYVVSANAACAGVSVSVEFDIPTMFDLYWIALPSKRNIHDAPVEVKPLNKIVSKLQKVIGPESVVINSTLTPIGRNYKLFKKLRLDYAGDVSWIYVPLDKSVYGRAGYRKVARRPETHLNAVIDGLELRKVDMEVLEHLTLAMITRDALIAQHTNEMATIASERSVKMTDFLNEYFLATEGKCPVSFGGITDLESVAVQMIVDKVDYRSSEMNKVGVTPILNGLLLGSKAFDDRYYNNVIQSAHALTPNSANESQLIILGSGEVANRLVVKLMDSPDLPEHTRLYQVPNGHAPVPGVETVTKERADELESLSTTVSFSIGWNQ